MGIGKRRFLTGQVFYSILDGVHGGVVDLARVLDDVEGDVGARVPCYPPR